MPETTNMFGGYTEYYTLGSRDEEVGLTLMTRQMNADGQPVVSMGNPEGWYKAQRITEGEYNALLAEMQSPGALTNGIGLVTLEVRDAIFKRDAMLRAKFWVDSNKIAIKRAARDAQDLGETLADCLAETSDEFKRAPVKLREFFLNAAEAYIAT